RQCAAAVPCDAGPGRRRAARLQPDLYRRVRPHRFDRQRRVQPDAVRTPRRVGGGLSVEPWRPGGADRDARLRRDAADRLERNRGRSRGQPPGGDQDRAGVAERPAAAALL
ncbi:hypothetical protein LTR94_032077, partial [Friedmanniomyces endolithicus]